MGDGNFLGLLQEVTHNGFMVGAAALSSLTVVVVGIAVGRLVPWERRDPTLPAHAKERS